MDHNDDASESNLTTKQKDDKLPHDASVFVGSLPSNIDQGDLTRMLMDHLSEHTQIKNIKVVRDSKGGVCAFVQCKDAPSATVLMKTLQNQSPRPFLGRILRYEPARAFRTLLISYRAPTQLARPTNFSPRDIATLKNDELQLDLPDSMRIWKHHNSRFHSILYNAEAVQAEEIRNKDESDGGSSPNAIFLQPMKYDEESLRKVANYFGPLEAFIVYEVHEGSDDSETSDTNSTQYPVPHNGPRAATMDTRCWEIKWEHRDDCVSALMTLRRVPHMTVTWAHQPSSQNDMFHSNFHSVAGSPTYSLHARHRGHPGRSPVSPHTPRFQTAYHYDASFPSLGRDLSPYQGSPHQSSVQEMSPYEGLETRALAGIEENGIATGTPVRRPWNRRAITIANPPGGRNIFKERLQEAYERDTSANLGDAPDADAQDLFMPQTPALDPSSITPLTPGSQFPITPTTSVGYESVVQDEKFPDGKGDSVSRDARSDKEVDPTTLFVGGLEMFGPGAWDEEKVRKFFERFGGLESVKVVRPLNACAAFAFVKFDNPESPARAVYEEHNRVYEGRAMRVQLRDCNPPRNNWKFGRGRGRFHQNHFNNGQRRFYSRSSHEGQVKDSLQVPNGSPAASGIGPGDTSDLSLSSLASALPSLAGTPQIENPSDTRTIENSGSSITSGISINDTPQTERYREWYDELESPAATPAPSSLGSSVSTGSMAYPAPPYPYMSNGPYFHPPPWMPPYMHQGPYQMPYYPGYPMYPPPPVPQRPVGSPPSSDASGPAVTPQAPWPAMGMYGSFVPYPVMPPLAPGHHGPPAMQAPLLPTGFIQNEQGTLVAVYQPEALDQYMANSGGTPHVGHHQENGAQRWVPPRPIEMGSIPQSNSHGTSHHPPAFPSAPSQRFDAHRPPMLSRGLQHDVFNSPSPQFNRRLGNRPPNNINSPRNNQNGHHQKMFNQVKPVRQHMQNLQVPDHGHHAGQAYAGWDH